MTTTTDNLAEALRVYLADLTDNGAGFPGPLRAALAAYDAERASAREPAHGETPPPWHYRDAGAGVYHVTARGYRVATCDGPGGIGRNDAARIVACVNACAGIPTEALERGEVYSVRGPAGEWSRDGQPNMGAAALLVHAYARGEAEGGSVDWDDVNRAWEAARVEIGSERVASIKALYAYADDTDADDEGGE